MSRILRIAPRAAGALFLLLTVSVGAGRWYQAQALNALSDSLETLSRSAGPLLSPQSVDLPEPVIRYLQWALPSDAVGPRAVRFSQTGSLRTRVETERWMPFEAEHLAAPRVTGFVWNAKVSAAPLVGIQVRDALVGGEGSGHVTLLSAFPVARSRGSPELNSGALHRFLAEAVWYPTALLPSERLAWTAIDEHRALATLSADGNEVSLEFRFAASGEVLSIYTPARWGSFDGGFMQRPWEGHFRDYQSYGGVRVPTEGDVGWYVDGVWQPVWKGRITSIRFED